MGESQNTSRTIAVEMSLTSIAILLLLAALTFGLVAGGAVLAGMYFMRDRDPDVPRSSTLAELVPDDQRPAVAKYYGDYALVAETGAIETVEEAYDVYRNSISILKSAKNWQGTNPQFDDAVSERLESDLGKSGPVSKGKLASAFRSIAKDLQ